MKQEKCIVVSAAYGMGNIGDEAISTMLIQDLLTLSPSAHITVLAWDVAIWKDAHPDLSDDERISVLPCFFTAPQATSLTTLLLIIKSIWNIMRCHVFIWGGGGIIRDRLYWLRAYLYPFRIARIFHKPVIIFSIGVEKVTNVDVKTCVAYVLNNSRAISVRDVQSKQNLEEVTDHKQDIEVISDGVFRFPSVSRSPLGEGIISLNLCNRDGYGQIDQYFHTFADTLATTLLKLYESYPFSIRAHSNCQKDQLYIHELAKHLPHIPFEYICTLKPEEYLASLAECALHVGMRMHSIILASRVDGLPFYGFIYNEKVLNLVHNAKAHEYFSPMDFTNCDEIALILEALATGGKPCCSLETFAQDSLGQVDFLRKNIGL